ncbi:GlsB/YeaQ/YmgE family stress response membrane protein [Kitasatospora sp. NPDC056651]|uniref:GlsB/YeaQ/YmgE family stress response membrane protein n=1 Tax=Kitasatospora sp. NPDC056651 TaxID=3345892 RepID=UPI00369321E7
MSWMEWIVLGLVAGTLARMAMPGRGERGLIGSTLIGITGSYVGTWIVSHWMHGAVRPRLLDVTTWVSAIGGAVVLLFAFRVLRFVARR